MTDHDGDPGIAWAEANAANDDGEAVMRAEREAAEADAAAGLCEQHGEVLPCAWCAGDRESLLRFLQGQSRIAGLLADRVQAAQAAVSVLAKYVEFERQDGRWDFGVDELADAAAVVYVLLEETEAYGRHSWLAVSIREEPDPIDGEGSDLD